MCTSPLHTFAPDFGNTPSLHTFAPDFGNIPFLRTLAPHSGNIPSLRTLAPHSGKIRAPKGRNKPAQGNALGLARRDGQALKGRHNATKFSSRPVRARRLCHREPRAMPWAVLLQPFRLREPAGGFATVVWRGVCGGVRRVRLVTNPARTFDNALTSRPTGSAKSSQTYSHEKHHPRLTLR